MKRLEALKQLWDNLPKTVKVFVYLLASALLSQLAIDVAGLAESSIWAKYLLIPINLLLVFLNKDVPAIRARIKK